MKLISPITHVYMMIVSLDSPYDMSVILHVLTCL